MGHGCLNPLIKAHGSGKKAALGERGLSGIKMLVPTTAGWAVGVRGQYAKQWLRPCAIFGYLLLGYGREVDLAAYI
jgi:hypothetical protein